MTLLYIASIGRAAEAVQEFEILFSRIVATTHVYEDIEVSEAETIGSVPEWELETGN